MLGAFPLVLPDFPPRVRRSDSLAPGDVFFYHNDDFFLIIMIMIIMMNPQVTWMVVVLPAKLELEERNPKKLSFPPRSRGRPCVPLLDHRHVFVRCPLV